MKCKICGSEFKPTDFNKEWGGKMERNCMCHTCNFWHEHLEEDKTLPPHTAAVIDGTHYLIGDENDKSAFRGFGGDRFKIRFNDGTTISTTNLWCQGEISPLWRKHFPDNATFDWQWKKIGSYNYLVPKENEEIPDELIAQSETNIGM